MASRTDVALRAARVLGATQEAQRLGCRLVGTEHLLMATMADPAVRAALLQLGHDLREVQTLVTAVSDGRDARDGPMSLSPRTEEALERVLHTAPELLHADEVVSPAQRSRGLTQLLACLLAGPADTAAQQVLTELGLTGRWEVFISAVEDRAGRTVRVGCRVDRARPVAQADVQPLDIHRAGELPTGARFVRR